MMVENNHKTVYIVVSMYIKAYIKNIKTDAMKIVYTITKFACFVFDFDFIFSRIKVCICVSSPRVTTRK